MYTGVSSVRIRRVNRKGHVYMATRSFISNVIWHMGFYINVIKAFPYYVCSHVVVINIVFFVFESFIRINIKMYTCQRKNVMENVIKEYIKYLSLSYNYVLEYKNMLNQKVVLYKMIKPE